MAPGARSKFAAPMFANEFFRKQMYCIEDSTCDVVGTFGAFRSDSAPPSPTVIRRPGDRSPLPLTGEQIFATFMDINEHGPLYYR